MLLLLLLSDRPFQSTAVRVDLNLERNFLGASGAASLSLSQALSVNSSLTDLNLCDNEIGDLCTASFSQALSVNFKLTYLNLERNVIGDSGVTSLSLTLFQPILRWLI